MNQKTQFQTLLSGLQAGPDLETRRQAFHALALSVAQAAQAIVQNPASGSGNRAAARHIARAAQAQARAVCYTQAA